MVRKPHIALIPTGGTIDSIGASRLDLTAYFETGQRLSTRELVDSIPELGDIADVEIIEFARVSSSALQPDDWLGLGRTVTSLLQREDCDGVVITHGTNTIEETAYFLALTVGADKPVVLVGAMRPASALGSDGALNLLRAVQVAASDAATGLGVLVVMNDAIYAARDVTKTSTYRVDAFGAPGLGPLGYADADGRVIVYHRHTRSGGAFNIEGLDHLPRVDIVMSYVGADGVFIDAAVSAGARGIVSAGTGAGRVTPSEEDAFDLAIAQGVIVCQASRVGAGRVAHVPTMAARKLVDANNLQPWKAKVLLSLALTRTSDTREVQELFDLL
jgi:L-asparaginase